MLRRVLMALTCLVALGVAVPAAADPTDPPSPTPPASPSTPISPSVAASSGPTSESPVSSPTEPTQSSVEPTAPPEPSVTASSSGSSPVTPTSASSSASNAGRTVAPTSRGAVEDGPSILSADGPTAVYVTVNCTSTPSADLVVDNPVPGITYTYRVVAEPGTDPVDLAGEIPSSPARPAVWLTNIPYGTYTVEVTGSDDSVAVSAPFTSAESCVDPPLIFFRIRATPCGPGEEATGISGYLENPKDDEVYTWHVISENGEMEPFTGPVAPDGTFTITGLVWGTYSVGFYGDEGSAFESNSFATYPCPTPTPTPPPATLPPSDSPPPSTTSSAPPQPIGSVDPTIGGTGGLAATGTDQGSLALLGAGVVALLAGFGVLRGRVRTGRRG